MICQEDREGYGHIQFDAVPTNHDAIKLRLEDDADDDEDNQLLYIISSGI